MSTYFKKFLSICIILVLLLLSGCTESVSDSSTLKSNEEALASDKATSKVMSEMASEITSATMSEAASEEIASDLKNHSKISSDIKASSKASSIGTKSEATSSQSEIKPCEINFKAVWISYYELPFWGSTKEVAGQKLEDMMKAVKNQGYTAVFCHVRGNADAFYPSDYFPYAMQLTGEAGKAPGYDPLEIMIWAAKKYGLEFHAWVNPYRVSNTSSDPNELADGHIAAKWLADGSNRAVAHNGQIYFNPSSTDVQKLILYGIREILENYNVDGIHFDDYFYPLGITEDFDKKQYEKYKNAAASPLRLDDWRRANVNALVSAVYRLCHSKGCVFGISPAANISFDNSHDNYNLLYADTALWMRREGFIDYIIPQLYFGYNHPKEKSRYGYLLNVWAKLPKHKNLKFYVGLGAYRMNEDCDDKSEWHNDATLMARQATDAVLKGADGIAVFSYTASTLNEPHNALQIKNMFEALTFKKE